MDALRAVALLGIVLFVLFAVTLGLIVSVSVVSGIMGEYYLCVGSMATATYLLLDVHNHGKNSEPWLWTLWKDLTWMR